MEAGFAGAAFDTAMAPYIKGEKPRVGYKKAALYDNSHMRTGMYYTGGPGNMEYYLVGRGQACPVGRPGWTNGPGTTQCSITLPVLQP